MKFVLGIAVGSIITFIVFIFILFMIGANSLNKEYEAYREGYKDGMKNAGVDFSLEDE